MVTAMREYDYRAPKTSIDPEKLRAVLAEIGTDEAREKFMGMLIADLERRPVTNLNDIRFLRLLRERHEAVTVFLQGAGEPHGQPLEIPNMHWRRWDYPRIVPGPAPVNPIREPGVICIPRRAEARLLMKDLTRPSIVIDCHENVRSGVAQVRRHRFVPIRRK